MRNLKPRTMRNSGNPQLSFKRVIASWRYISQFPGITLAARANTDLFVYGETREREVDRIFSGHDRFRKKEGAETYWPRSLGAVRMKYCADGSNVIPEDCYLFGSWSNRSGLRMLRLNTANSVNYLSWLGPRRMPLAVVVDFLTVSLESACNLCVTIRRSSVVFSGFVMTVKPYAIFLGGWNGLRGRWLFFNSVPGLSPCLLSFDDLRAS